MKSNTLILAGALVLIIAALAAGLIAGQSLKASSAAVTPQANDTPVAPVFIIPETFIIDNTAIVDVATFDMNTEGSLTVNVTKDQYIAVYIKENPTTGYLWDITSTQGLNVLNSTYKADTDLAGSPGTRQWIIQPSAAGKQKFMAVSHRPSENVTDTDPVFQITLNVV